MNASLLRLAYQYFAANVSTTPRYLMLEAIVCRRYIVYVMMVLSISTGVSIACLNTGLMFDAV